MRSTPILHCFTVLTIDVQSRLHNLHEEVSCSVCMTKFTNPKQLPCLHSFGLHCLQRIQQTSGIQETMSGADPGFFLGGGAPLRNGVTDFFFFFENTSCITKPQVISEGVGGRCVPPASSP